MNTEYLKTFLDLAKSSSFSRTAKDNVVVQSTVSNRIRELENTVGQKLFIRAHRRIELTPAGRALLEYAEKIISLEEKAIEQANLSERYSDRLVLGTVYAFYDVCLEKALETFIDAYPRISVNVVFGHSGRIIAGCRNENIDIGFSHYPFDHPEYHCELFAEDDVILIGNAQNQIYRDGILSSMVRELPIIYSNFLYETSHNWLFSKHQQFQLELEIGIKALPFVLRGNGYTLLARRLVQDAISAGQVVEIPILDGAIPPVRYYSIRKKDGRMDEIWGYLQKCFLKPTFLS